MSVSTCPPGGFSPPASHTCLHPHTPTCVPLWQQWRKQSYETATQRPRRDRHAHIDCHTSARPSADTGRRCNSGEGDHRRWQYSSGQDDRDAPTRKRGAARRGMRRPFDRLCPRPQATTLSPPICQHPERTVAHQRASHQRGSHSRGFVPPLLDLSPLGIGLAFGNRVLLFRSYETPLTNPTCTFD